MIKASALVVLVAATLAIAAAYASALLPGSVPNGAPWLLAIGTAAAMVALMALGAVKRGGIGRLAYPFALIFILLTAGFAAALALPPAGPADTDLWLGLPPRAAIVLYGIGLLPLLIVPLAYAWTFDHLTLSDRDLDRLREMTDTASDRQ